MRGIEALERKLEEAKAEVDAARKAFQAARETLQAASEMEVGSRRQLIEALKAQSKTKIEGK